MEKRIKIGDKEILFKSTGSTAIRYRAMFNDDLVERMMSISKSAVNGEEISGDNLEALEKAAYVMAKQGGDDAPSFEEWLDNFEMFEIIEALPEVMELWGLNMVTTSKPRKKK